MGYSGNCMGILGLLPSAASLVLITKSSSLHLGGIGAKLVQ